MNVLIGGAWPYANGSLHIGHIAGLLPGDVLARYHRVKGDKVYYVSGSDCHGTPVALRAKQEDKTPFEISEYYHNEFSECFEKLGFSYDHYGKTSSEEHKNFIKEFHEAMYAGDLLLANGKGWHLPDQIISSEYLTLEGRKISTSLNWAIWINDIVDRYNPDSIRYFMIANGPEKRDTDFSWREFVNSHNGELLGAYGNFINRTLVFISKYYNSTIPDGKLNDEIENRINSLFPLTGKLIEAGELKDAIEGIFEFIRDSNKYFDTEKPWETRATDLDKCNTAIFNCVQIIVNLALLLKPFLPFSSQKVQSWFKFSDEWKPQYVPVGFIIPEPEILFERIDKKVIDVEVQRLGL